MPTKPNSFDADDIVRRYVAGTSQMELRKTFGVSDLRIRKCLEAAGVHIRTNAEARIGLERVTVDAKAIVSRYLAGESEKALAEAFNTSRPTIRKRLVDAGVTPRNRSEGMYTRMAQTTQEERQRLSAAAHDAVRGSKRTRESVVEAARRREGRINGSVSPAELLLADMLHERGVEVIHQKAVGPYNVDLAAGSVAVEVLGGGWHRSKRHGERLRYLLDSGWDVIYIWDDGAKGFPLGPGAAEYVISHLEFREGDPSTPRGYGVIRGTGEVLAGGRVDRDDIPDVLPNSDRPEVAPTVVPIGFCHCGCGQRTRINRCTRTERGVLKGMPSRFVSGHNHRGRRDAS